MIPFAVDLSDLVPLIIFLIFGGISLLNQLLNMGKEQRPRRRPERRPDAPPRERATPQRVDEFLQEMLGTRPAEPARAEKPQRPPARPRATTTSAPPTRLEPARPQSPAPPRPSTPTTRVTKPVTPESRDPFGDSPPPRRGFPDKSFNKKISQSIRAAGDATTRAGELTRIATTAKAAAPVRRDELIAMLGDSGGVRNALVVAEILGPPKSLRRKR